MKIFENYSLKSLNTFGIDAKTTKLISFSDEKEIFSLLETNELQNQKILILGGGSNILFQNDFDGIILKSEIMGITEIDKNDDHVILEIGSGVIWDDLVDYCVNNGLGGIENLSLIPGTVGAAPIQNIGAYGTEFEEVFIELEGIDLQNKVKRKFSKVDCQFGYRDSIFKKSYINSFLISTVRIRLSRSPKLNINYRAINDYIKQYKISKAKLDIKQISDIVKNIRKSKLPDPSKIGNAGSFFKNPIVKFDRFLDLKEEFSDLVFFEIANKQFKIPAGWLIEKAGLKGKRFGNVGIHKQQALVLVNYGDGTGEELVNLSNKIKSVIFEKFNIVLETEVNIVK
jgi:UDP-N-acetylmuramate dehydrogenase